MKKFKKGGKRMADGGMTTREAKAPKMERDMSASPGRRMGQNRPEMPMPGRRMGQTRPDAPSAGVSNELPTMKAPPAFAALGPQPMPRGGMPVGAPRPAPMPRGLPEATPAPMPAAPGMPRMKKGGMVKNKGKTYAKGGMVKGSGCATRGVKKAKYS